jgi:hypothetical protein
MFGRVRIMTKHRALLKAPTTPWRWQPFAETCRGRIWNALIKIHYFLEQMLLISQRYYKMLGQTINSSFKCWGTALSSEKSYRVSAITGSDVSNTRTSLILTAEKSYDNSKRRCVLTSIHRVTSHKTAVFNVSTIETSYHSTQGLPWELMETAVTTSVV